MFQSFSSSLAIVLGVTRHEWHVTDFTGAEREYPETDITDVMVAEKTLACGHAPCVNFSVPVRKRGKASMKAKSLIERCMSSAI